MKKEKGIIIIGPQESGKTVLAKGFMANYKNGEAVMFDGKMFNLDNSFPFQICTPETEMIVFDDLPPDKFWDIWTTLYEPFEVERRCKDSFILDPEYIVYGINNDTEGFESILASQSIARRFDIYKLEKHKP